MVHHLQLKFGLFLVEIRHQKLVKCVWFDAQLPENQVKHRDNFLCRVVQQQLNEYFLYKRKYFDIELTFNQNTTCFQQDVWRVVMQIPYGETCTYKDIATRIGKPNASRAVGRAVGANPFHILIPCHRVVATGGGMRGYAGGLQIKKDLLAHEKI